jgi:hypothetical protein
MNGKAVCTPNTTVYDNWAHPLGYCSGSATAPVYTPPRQAVSAQGLIISSCVFVCIAAIIGSFDACSEGESTVMAKASLAFSFLAMILLICSFSVWVDFPFTTLTTSYDGFYIPIWVNPYENILSAVPIYYVLGPGFGCCLFAFILNFFGTALHIMSMSSLVRPEELPAIPGLPGSTTTAVPPAVGATASVAGPVVSV